MFGRKIDLFKIFGFRVSIDLSWFLIFVLIVWSLAMNVFPSYFSGLSKITYWIMGFAGAFGLFFSVILHELSHSLIAKRHGLPMTGITLFIFGGVAEMQDEPPSPRAEFYMAAAGPLTSIVIALIFLGLSFVIKDTIKPVYGVFRYLALINGALAAFNLIPAFPLDGGRILRSAIWKSKNNLKKATYISSRIGLVFGVVISGLGFVTFLFGNFVGGVWWFLIGMFLINAARMSYQQLLMRRALEGEKISRFMERETVTVPSYTTFQDLVENFFYKFHYKMFPVVDDGKLLGCINTKQLKSVPREEWETRTVGELCYKCTGENTVSPDADAMKVLSIMNRTGISRLMVVKDSKLIGIITLKDLLKFISLRVELEEE